MVDTCHSVFDQAHSIYEIKTEPNLDHRIWMPTVCQCRFIKYMECTTLAGHGDAGGHCGGRSKAGVCGNPVYFPL